MFEMLIPRAIQSAANRSCPDKHTRAGIRATTIMWGLASFLATLVAIAPVHADPQLTQDDDGRVNIKAERYTAAVAPDGSLADVMVDGLPTIYGGFPKIEDGPLPSVNLTGNLVAVRRGSQRVEYTFFDTHIKVETEGYPFVLSYVPASCEAVVAENGKGGPVTKNTSYGRSTAIVLTNGKSIAYSKPFHFTPIKRGELVFSNYLNHSVKRGDLIVFEIELGLSAQAVDMLSGLSVGAPTASYGPLHENGNTGKNLTHFQTPQTSLSIQHRSTRQTKRFPGSRMN